LLVEFVHRVSDADSNTHEDAQTYLHAHIHTHPNAGGDPDAYSHGHTNGHSHTSGDRYSYTHHAPSHCHQAAGHPDGHSAGCHTDAQRSHRNPQALVRF
jgi:hypothetical protein